MPDPAPVPPADAAWHIRPAVPDDEPALIALFERVFGRPIGAAAWRWKLRARPTPAPNVWVAAADADGTLIAQYAGIPVQVQIAGQVRPAMVSVDTITAPEWRRRGILTRLAAEVYAAWQAAGVTAVLGLPNEQWGSRTNALGWVSCFPLAWQRAPLHVERVVARRLPGPLQGAARAAGGGAAAIWHRLRGGALARVGRWLRVTALTTADSALDALWAALALAYPHLIVRDAAWVAWRYLAAPGFGYRVLLATGPAGAPTGYCAYRLTTAGDRCSALVADLFTAPDDRATVAALLGAAFDDLWARDAETARVPVAPGSALARLVGSAGFRPAPGAFSFAVVPLAPDLDVAPLQDPAAWLLTGGDFDVA